MKTVFERQCLVAAFIVLVSLAAVVIAKEAGCEEGYDHCFKRRLLSAEGGEGSLVLKQVVVIHRHGDRAPLSLVIGNWQQTDELEEFWKSRLPTRETIERWGELGTDATGTYLKPKGEHSNTGWPYGHLTRVGGDQLRSLGSKLRERYVGSLSFLPSILPLDPSSVIQVRSTRYPRTLHSVQNLLLGLFPADHRVHDTKGKPASIPINTVSKLEEYLDGGSEESCPRLKELREELDKMLQHPPRFVQAQSKLISRFGTDAAGQQLNVSFIRASEVGICHRSHGIPLPGDLPGEDLQEVTDFNAWIYARRGANVDISRLGTGPLVSDISGGFDAMAAHGQGPLLRVFSGHDTTLMPILAALGANDEQWPPYASYITMELLYDERADQHLVRVIYNGKPLALFGGKQSSFAMPLKDFKVALADRMMPSDWKEQCM